MTDDPAHQNFIDRKTLEYQVGAIVLTFCTIAIAVWVYIASFSLFWVTFISGLIVLAFCILFGVPLCQN